MQFVEGAQFLDSSTSYTVLLAPPVFVLVKKNKKKTTLYIHLLNFSNNNNNWNSYLSMNNKSHSYKIWACNKKTKLAWEDLGFLEFCLS